jgi:uncharacterized protein YjbI with pentapeptide repeats
MQGLIVETKKIKETSGYTKLHPKDEAARLLPEFRSTAQALTLSVLEQLDGKRKGKVIIYLAESQLITVDNNKLSTQPEIKLDGANLAGMVLNNVDQVMVDKKPLGIAITGADMTDSTIKSVRLFVDSQLGRSDFSRANLTDVYFTNANMSLAKFFQGTINVNFDGTILKETIFDGVRLENVVFNPATNFDYACFTTSTTFYNTNQFGNLLTKDILKELKEKRDISINLEAKTSQDCKRQIKT